jgi:type I restriction enzyme S subunit
MNAESLLAQYERIADAPDAVTRLRRFILDLAVRGKLVPQDSKDEPALELLKQIANANARPAPRVGTRLVEQEPEAGHPFEIPTSWRWARIDTISYVEMGQSPPSEHYNQHREGIAFFQGKTDFGKRNPVPRYWCTQPTKFARIGDILISVRAPVGPTNVADQDCCIGRGLAALRPYDGIDRDFLLLVLKAREADLQMLGFGTTFVAINKKHLTTFQVPLPPLAEQHRIVAKVDELMALCDRLEAERTQREAVRDRLTTASLARLSAPDPETFPDAARFVLDALLALTTRPDQIKRLRQAILDLAVRGKLVQQDANDEPASELLKRIAKDKARLVKTGEARKLEVDPVAPGDKPFAIPAAWTWTRLGSIGDWGSGSTPPRGAPGLYGGTVTWLKSGELSDNRTLAGSEEKVTEAAISKGSFRLNRRGDVLIAMYGATIGKVAILAESAVTNQAVCGCTPFSGVFNQFLFLFLLSQREHFHSASEGGAQPNISKVKIVWTPFPLPPLSEQHRIVAKVDELMALCDRLEASLADGTKSRNRLLDALLAEALAPPESAAA